MDFEIELQKVWREQVRTREGGVVASYEAFPELFRESFCLGSIWQSGPYIHAWKTSPPMS